MDVTSLGVNGVLHQQSPPLPARLQAALNLIPGYTWYVLPNGALAFVNERQADYLGVPIDHPFRFGIKTDGEWDSHSSLLHADDREETRRVWSDCLRTGSAREVSVRVLNGEGGYRWFLSRAEPVRAANGTVLYWIGVNLDTDQQKRAEQELRDIFETVPALIWVAQPDGSNVPPRVTLVCWGRLLSWRGETVFSLRLAEWGAPWQTPNNA